MSILNKTNQTIISRGYNYYKGNRITNLQKISDSEFSSVASGTSEYNVLLNIDNYKKCNCTCPYNKKICKHIVATYYMAFPEAVLLFEESLKRRIKEWKKYEKEQEEKRKLIYDSAVEYVNSLTEDQIKNELISRIVAEGYEYDNYYDERYEEEYDILYEIDPDIIEQLEKASNPPKLSQFIDAFESISDDEQWIDIRTAEVLGNYDFELEDMDEEEIEDFLSNEYILALPSRYELNEYNDMLNFVDSIENVKIQEKLFSTLKGHKAFRRFKDEIIYMGISDKWYAYRDECLKRKVILWLEENDIEYEED